MKLKGYFLLATFAPNPQSVNGLVRRLRWNKGVSGPFSPDDARKLGRRLGAGVITIDVEIGDPWCECGQRSKEDCASRCIQPLPDELEEPAVTQEGQEEIAPPGEDLEVKWADSYPEQVSELAAAKDEGVFDWLEFTGGKRTKQAVEEAYIALKTQEAEIEL